MVFARKGKDENRTRLFGSPKWFSVKAFNIAGLAERLKGG